MQLRAAVGIILMITTSLLTSADCFARGFKPIRIKPEKFSTKIAPQVVATESDGKLEQQKMEVWRKLKNVKNADDVMAMFPKRAGFSFTKVKIEGRKPPPGIKTVVGSIEQEDKYVISETGDGVKSSTGSSEEKTVAFNTLDCEPRPQIVEIKEDANYAYWPGCVELMQCGGCCSNGAYMECAPLEIENKSVSVLKIGYFDSQVSLYNHYAIHHKKCGCKCKIQPGDCTPQQVYDPNNCICKCSKDFEKCPPGMQWSLSACGCVCSHRVETCNSRKVWNENTCKCECVPRWCGEEGKVQDPATCYCVLSMFSRMTKIDMH